MKKFIENLYEIEKECFGKNAWSEHQIESHLKNGKIITLSEKEIIGYALYYENEDYIEILRIGVKEKYRRKGYATQILNDLIQLKRTIFLEVHEENLPARKFYIKNGFKEISTRKKYYPDGKAAIVMCLSLAKR